MIIFTTIIKRFGSQGEKTGWTYIDIPEALALQLVPNNKRAFRVKGKLDNHNFSGISLVPVGGGDFIMPLNSEVRKHIGKTKGATIEVKMEVDTNPVIISPELMQCLADEPAALAYFTKLPGSHQKYYSRWIESAKTEETKAKRIAHAVNACAYGKGYSEMIRSIKSEKDELPG